VTPRSSVTSEDVVKKRPDGDVEQMSISQCLDLHLLVPGEVMLEDDVPWIGNTRASLPPPGFGSRNRLSKGNGHVRLDYNS
jgi:hypothetical protein